MTYISNYLHLGKRLRIGDMDNVVYSTIGLRINSALGHFNVCFESYLLDAIH